MIVGTSSGGDRDRSNEDNNNDRDIGSYNVDGSATKIVIMMVIMVVHDDDNNDNNSHNDNSKMLKATIMMMEKDM